MLNYEGLARCAAERITDNMQKKMMDENYLIHNAVITIDVENRKMTVEAIRKDPHSIEYRATKTVEI